MEVQANLGEIIEIQRKRLGYSQRLLALHAEISNTTISRLEKNLIENPDVDTLLKIERALGLPENHLVAIAYPKLGSSLESSKDGGYRPRRIPIYQESHLAQGAPLLTRETPLGYDYVVEDESLKNCFYLRVTGDWMTKSRLFPGDQVLVAPQKEYQSGDVVVFQNGQKEISIKRFFRKGNTLVFQPDSFNSEHQLELYSPRALQRKEIKIFGKVLYGKVFFETSHDLVPRP